MQIYTGKDDSILRRMVVALGIVAPEGSSSPTGPPTSGSTSRSPASMRIRRSPSPPTPKPFDQLLSQLGGLGLGGLGGGSGCRAPASGSRRRATTPNLEKYSKCVTDAGCDTTKARKCADLLEQP